MSNSHELVSDLCRAINTPLSLGLFLRLKYKVELSSLVGRSPLSYLDSESYFKDAQVVALVKKCVDLGSNSEARKTAAFSRWLTAERQCFTTNRRFYSYLDTGFFPGENQVFFHNFVEEVKKVIAEALGPVPHDLRGAFGPGRTALIDKAVCIETKFVSPPELTGEAWLHLRSEMTGLWSHCLSGSEFSELNRSVDDFPFVRGNVWGSVPKNSSTDRSIGFEPSFNLFVQKSIGSKLKSRLRRLGLLDQHARCPVFDGRQYIAGRRARLAKDHHMRLARLSSIDDTLATIDLSNASDTVSSAVVETLLPKPWFQLLDSVRSPMTNVNGRWYRLEKFSSMGNAFTFELETLIFYALCKATGKYFSVDLDTSENFSVFGDDMIVPSSIAHPLLSVLQFFGFTTNAEKTFLHGPFRESCGGDYYAGCDVRPFFYTRAPRNPSEIFALCNKIWKVRDRLPALLEVRKKLIGQLPLPLRRVTGDASLGDSVLHDDFQFIRVRDGIRECRVLVSQQVSFPREHWGSEHAVIGAMIYDPQGDISITARDLTGKVFLNGMRFYNRIKGCEKRISFHNSQVCGYVVRWTPIK